MSPKQLDLDGTTLTLTTQELGTLRYMAPEQIADAKRAGPPADVFALGKILAHMLTGRRPEPGRVDLSHVSKAFRFFVDKCCRDNPDRRYPDASASLVAFHRVGYLLPSPSPSAALVRSARERRGGGEVEYPSERRAAYIKRIALLRALAARIGRAGCSPETTRGSEGDSPLHRMLVPPEQELPPEDAAEKLNESASAAVGTPRQAEAVDELQEHFRAFPGNSRMYRRAFPRMSSKVARAWITHDRSGFTEALEVYDRHAAENDSFACGDVIADFYVSLFGMTDDLTIRRTLLVGLRAYDVIGDGVTV